MVYNYWLAILRLDYNDCIYVYWCWLIYNWDASDCCVCYNDWIRCIFYCLSFYDVCYRLFMDAFWLNWIWFNYCMVCWYDDIDVRIYCIYDWWFDYKLRYVLFLLMSCYIYVYNWVILWLV